MHLAKSFWNPFETEFECYATDLRRLNEEVKEEIRLASYQAAEQDQRLQVLERQVATSHRRLGRLHHEKFDRVSREDQEWKIKALERESSKLKWFSTNIASNPRCVGTRKQLLLDKLSMYDYVASLKRERKKRYGSTSRWLSKTPEYNAWLLDNSSCFWLSGIVGGGKTVCPFCPLSA